MAANLLKSSRTLHLYFGVFITPAILFFALTGALQTFGLHETNRDHPDYKPARWIVVLGQLHKKQTSIVPVRKQQPPQPSVGNDQGGRKPDATGTAGPGVHAKNGPTANGRGDRSTEDAASKTPDKPAAQPATQAINQPHRHPLPLRIFFLVVSIGLFSSTSTGLYMSYKFSRNKILITLTLVAGIVLPLALVFV